MVALFPTFMYFASLDKNGSFTVKKYTVPYANKNSWAWGYVLLSRIIAVVCVILLGIMLVTFFQNYLNCGRIILKMPLMLYISMAFINLSGVLRFEGKINAQDLD